MGILGKRKTEVCKDCKQEKDISQFDTYVNRDGFERYSKRCRECKNKRQVLSRKENRDERHLWRQKQYGITEAQYDVILKSQNGVCKICERPETVKDNQGHGQIKHLSVDHDHRTSKIRGLLCANCN